MKILLLADIHFGIRSDSEYFRKKQLKFFDELRQYIHNHKEINQIAILGDIMDKRKSVDFQTMDLAKMCIDNLSITVPKNIIVGNHDSYFKNTLQLNSVDLLFNNGNPYVNVYSKPITVDNICYIPWICDDNYDACMKEIETTDADICFGHFEFSGCQFNKHTVAKTGMDTGLFKKFKSVITGHYHIKSDNGNIHYLGSPIQYTWDDYNTKKGFHIFDTETHKLEFIENKDTIFRIYNYGDEIDDCSDCIVRVYCDDSIGQKDVDKFVNKIKEQNPHDIKVIFNTTKKDIIKDEDIVCVDTLQSMTSYSGYYISEDMDESKMNNIIDIVYKEAINLK